MAEFETGGHKYRADKMNARDQLHLLRGLGPLLPAMVQLALINPSDTTQAANQMAFMVPFFEAFAKMEQQEVDTLVNKCYSVTRRYEGGNGSGVWSGPLWQGRDQYNDIELASLMTICWQVIQENLGGFFAIGQVPMTDGTELAPPMASVG